MRLRVSSMKPEKQKENPGNLFCNSLIENMVDHSDIFSTSTSDTVYFLMETHFSGYQDVGEGLYTHTIRTAAHMEEIFSIIADFIHKAGNITTHG